MDEISCGSFFNAQDKNKNFFREKITGKVKRVIVKY